MSHLAALMLERWSRVSLSPRRPFPVEVPTLGGPYQTLLWLQTMAWQYQRNQGSISGQNPAALRNSQTSFLVLGQDIEQMACFLSCLSAGCPFEMTKPKCLTSCLSLFPWHIYPVVESRANRSLVPLQQSPWVGLASNKSSTYWSRVQFKVSPGKAARSAARDSLNRVGEFLKPCGSRVQVSCVFLSVCGSSHSKANKDWLAGDSRRQKNASLRWRQVNQLA